MAVGSIELALAISPRVTIAGAVVKTEVKNIPAIKLPNNSSSCVEVSIFIKTFVFTKITAIMTLKTIIAVSCNKKLFWRLLVFIRFHYYTNKNDGFPYVTIIHMMGFYNYGGMMGGFGGLGF